MAMYRKDEKPEIKMVRRLADLDRSFNGNTERLFIDLNEMGGKKFVNMRVWYATNDGEMRPGKAGITIRAREIDDVIAALQGVRTEFIAQLIEAPRKPHQQLSQYRGTMPEYNAPQRQRGGEDEQPF